MAIKRIEVIDFEAMGRKVAEWTLNPCSRPGSVDELKEQLADIATVPDRIQELEFVSGTLSKLIIRLPPAEMLKESIDNISEDVTYPMPTYYADKINSPSSISNEEFLYSRVGDYTIAQCR